MKITYKCACMSEPRELTVTHRPKNGDLLVWVEHVVGGNITLDHQTVSPLCSRTTMEYVAVPMEEGSAGLGMAPSLH